MQKRSIVIGVAAGLICLTPAAYAGSQAESQGAAGFRQSTVDGADIDIQETNGIRHVSGGVGDEEQSALHRAKRDFNLEVSMATRDGKYMGNGTVVIADKSGRTVLETPTTGPIFMAKLPAGQYKVTAKAAGAQSLERTVNVPASGHQQITLMWPNAAGEPATRFGDAPADPSDANDLR